MGLKQYSALYGMPYDYASSTTTPSISTIWIQLEKNCPVLISATNFDGTEGGHSIVAYKCDQSSVTVATG